MFSTVFLLFLLLLSGCSPVYVFRAAYEEGKILWRRQPISEMLKDPELDPKKREKLELVLAARTFAHDRLQLNVGGSYSGYSYVDGSVVSYVLTAVPGTSLQPNTWWFPFVGRMPYKGYFSEDDAKKAAQGLKNRGYDTFVRPVSAFSTLGWFDDPLLSHLIELDKAVLVEVIFHELFHNTLFVVEAVAFNESIASFVGNRAAIIFLEDRFGKGSTEFREAVQSWKQELEFSVVLNEVAAALGDLYRRDIPDEKKLELRQGIFSRSQQEWSNLITDRPQHRYGSYAKREVNNAVIAHYQLYLGGLHLFESIYQSQGKDLVRVWMVIEESVEISDDPWDGVRELLPSQSSLPAPESSPISHP